MKIPTSGNTGRKWGTRPTLYELFFHHVIDGYEFVAFGFIARDHVVGCDYCLRTIRTHLLVATVMEEDHVASANFSGAFLLDLGGRRRIPIVAGDVPHDRLQAHFARDAKYSGTAPTEGWTEQVRVFADGIAQGRATIGEFLTHIGAALKSQERMREGVIANDVSAFDEFLDDVGTLLCIASDQKKCGFRVVTGENFQQTKRMRIVGAVVIRKSELLRSQRDAGKGATVPLACRRHRLIAGGDECTGNSRAGEYGGEHGGIVAD
jgi:hypothetical protein